jgi:hypothetical protein
VKLTEETRGRRCWRATGGEDLRMVLGLRRAPTNTLGDRKLSGQDSKVEGSKRLFTSW